MYNFQISIFAVLLAWTAIVFLIGHKIGEDSAFEELERIMDKAREDLIGLMEESQRMIENKKVYKDKPIKKYKEEHEELQNEVARGNITVDEYVEEYNKLIRKESEDMERSDPPGVPHEHI